MRDLNEYKAEIFRRSEERILKRIEKKKKRNKLLFSLCLPLCLAVIISSVMLLPSIVGDSSESGENDNLICDADGADGATATEPELQHYLYADVSFGEYNGREYRIDTPERLKALSEVIENAYADSYLWYDITERGDEYKERDDDQDGAEMYDIKDESISESQIDRYTITLTASDGYKKTIIITGNTISDPELDIEVTLKEERLEELKTFLTSD